MNPQPSLQIPKMQDYGTCLYSSADFKELFPEFEKQNDKAAKTLWDRVFSRCGKDVDLPIINTVIDFGCGNGSFLKKLSAIAKGSPVKCSEFKWIGLDCSAEAVKIANAHNTNDIKFLPCEEDPEVALAHVDLTSVSWETTALIVMGHSWFHIDQKKLIAAILERRPALLLVDIFATWDKAVQELREGKDFYLEHGRQWKTGTMWLKSEKHGDACMKRGLWVEPNFSKGYFFETYQELLTTDELLGGFPFRLDEEALASNELIQARNNGLLRNDSGLAYVRRRVYAHESGWGNMHCHVLAARSATAAILNEAYFETVAGLFPKFKASVDPTIDRIRQMFALFDEKMPKEDGMPGSREALVIQPFDPNHVFTKIIPLHGEDYEISSHPLLVEHPSREQTHYPSALGVFQTLCASTSSAQAFPVDWAPDYEKTPADKAIGKLELPVLGLDNQGRWGKDKSPASYFMVPFYFGSLPLFCLALKFPRTFDPTTTGFDVYYSTIKSIHDSIMVLFTDEKIKQLILRPWIEKVITSPQWKSCKIPDILEKVEFHLFGEEGNDPVMGESSPIYYCLDGMPRHGGALGREWKSWLLGLPSQPIKTMVSVQAQNARFWRLWNEEKDFALKDPALRISLWFEEGGFFEDKVHDKFCEVEHLKRLDSMFCRLGYKMRCPAKKHLSAAIQWLVEQRDAECEPVTRYFGKSTTKHFLFSWTLQKLRCLDNNSFNALKAVFCKTNANTGYGMRFGKERLFHLLDAARIRDQEPEAGKMDPSSPKCISDFPEIDKKFWSKEDPSMLIAEFAHCFSKMGIQDQPRESILESITIKPKQCRTHVAVCVEIQITIQLMENWGGSKKYLLDKAASEIRKNCILELGEYHNCNKILIKFNVDGKGNFKPTSEI